MRVGLGVDLHPFSGDPSRPLVLGGVVIPGVPGLAGHSDADVVVHALADSLLGAAGMGDLGTRFPAGDERFAGAASTELLREVVEALHEAGLGVENADVALVAEWPVLAPFRAAMESTLAGILAAPVRVAPKRAEGLGALGRREGMGAWAVVLVDQRERVGP